MAETLETLATRIDAFATSVSQRFDGIDQRLTGIDTRFDGIDTRLAGIDTRFDGIDMRLDGIDQRLAGIDTRFDGIDTRLVDLKAELLIRIEAVDTKVGLVLEKVDHLIHRDVANSVAHARFEQRLDNHELRIIALESRENTESTTDS
jgi:archaellum component FlaC